MQGIILSLNKSKLFTAIDVIELIDEESVKFIKIKATLYNESILFIHELYTHSYQKYSYHWQQGNGELILRWDNKPHWKEHSTFPFHMHERDTVLPCHRITIDEVIEIIQKKIGS